MYSVFLAAALASSPIAPDCHWDCGYSGCWSGGYGCSGYYGGYDCSGYYGGYADYGWCAPMQAAATAPARLIVQLPADAKLFMDEQLTSSRSAERSFVTPELEPGYVYTYTVRAEIVRDGEKYVETRKVDVTAGNVSQLSFTEAAMVRANGGQGAQAVASAGR
jgi:uncharacterized protein (TIGR03000 family)